MFDRFRSRNNALSDEAIQWVVRMGGTPSQAERAAFQAWRQRSPAHEQALRQAEVLLAGIAHTEVAAEHRRMVRALTPPRRGISRRQLLAGGLSAAAVTGLVGSGVFGPPAGFLADQSTRIGQRRQAALPDGSLAWLNTASAVSFDYSAAARQVSVRTGEVLFDVVADAKRLFVARGRHGQAEASDGRFAMRCGAGHSTLTVLAGVVTVGNEAGRVQLAENQCIAFSADLLGKVEAVDADAATAWTRGKLIFNQQLLASIATELERYVPGRVVVVGDALRQLQLSGVFDLDDVDALLRTVASLANAAIVRLPLLTLLR